MTDERRKIIAEAMEAIENGWHKESHVGPTGVRRYIEESSRALPVAVELIEELAADLNHEREGLRIARRCCEERGAKIEPLRQKVAEQAKEIERLRKYITATAQSKSEAKRVISMCGDDE